MNESDRISLIEILLVEDNPADVRLTREALKQDKFYTNLSVVNDGEDALAWLRREGKFAAAVRPDLILLDLNLPKKDDREVLQEIKNDEDLRRIPVVVLTVSKSDEDVLGAYHLHANCFITKPVDLDQFKAIARNIQEFWFAIVRLPGKED